MRTGARKLYHKEGLSGIGVPNVQYVFFLLLCESAVTHGRRIARSKAVRVRLFGRCWVFMALLLRCVIVVWGK